MPRYDFSSATACLLKAEKSHRVPTGTSASHGSQPCVFAARHWQAAVSEPTARSELLSAAEEAVMGCLAGKAGGRTAILVHAVAAFQDLLQKNLSRHWFQPCCRRNGR